MLADGSDVQNHVPWKVHRRGEYEASVSPDGSQVAFTTYRYGGWKIAVANMDGSNVRRVTMDPQYAYDPHWTPDGKSLIYRRIVNKGGAYFRGNGDIYKINLDGSGNVNLSNTEDEHDRNAAVSPDGKAILYDSFVGDSLNIFLMGADGGNRIAIEGAAAYMFAPSWSPDGEWVAHLRSSNEGFVDVWVMKPDGTEARNLTKSKAKGFQPAGDALQHWNFETSWSPDGQLIAFVSDYEEMNNADIYTVSVETGAIKRLTKHPKLDLHPYWYE